MTDRYPPPLSVLSFDITGATMGDLLRQANELATRFADGSPYLLDSLDARPQITLGNGDVVMWEASCSATIYPSEKQQ